jgi:cell fate regulator YaaT (PSP1 superfamily)
MHSIHHNPVLKLLPPPQRQPFSLDRGIVYDRCMDFPLNPDVLTPWPTWVPLVGVKIRNRGEVKKLGSNGLSFSHGDPVLLDVDGEVTYGIIYTESYSAPFTPPMRAMKSILRKPDAEEAELITRLERLAEEAAGYCKAKAADLNIRLKLVEVYGAMDRRQLTFVYTADERIDFRELVRDLARRFGGRIEMRQVGVREEAKRLGGIDTCGLVLCCASFLTDVKPVTAKQAKNMDLPIDDPRLLGVCGRLKCCLMFEMMDAQGKIPSQPQQLITPTKVNSPSSPILPS